MTYDITEALKCAYTAIHCNTLKYTHMMMMIAFITITSGLVPLTEGLCAQTYNFIFEIIGGFAFTSFAFEEKSR